MTLPDRGAVWVQTTARISLALVTERLPNERL
jgi:hypothetical protein